MDAAQTIRHAVSKIAGFRATHVSNPQLARAIAELKSFQTRRFLKTYSDLLAGGPYQPAAKFFLEELYGEKDYSERDLQFSRIAGAIQKLMPNAAVATAVLLAKLHLLTEELDQAMGLAWLRLAPDAQSQDLTVSNNALRYVKAWREVGRQADRALQLANVLDVGNDLDRLTRMPGLRLTLKMMRRPAQAAGLSDLQQFLEMGFDTFAGMGKKSKDVQNFLALVNQRESALMENLFLLPDLEVANQLND